MAQKVPCPSTFKRNNGQGCTSGIFGGKLTVTFADAPSGNIQALDDIILITTDGPIPTKLLPSSREIKKSVVYSWCFDDRNVPPANSWTSLVIYLYNDVNNDNIYDSTNTAEKNSRNNNCAGSGGAFILPVSFLSFEAQKVNQTVALNWVTASEIENAGFYVERKAEGEANFTSIGYTMSGLAGGTGAGHTYRFIDPKIPAGRLFYRLRQVDLDGTTSYSEVVTVSNSESAALKILTYPNPSNGNFRLSLPSGIGNTNIELKRVTGEVVSRWNNYSSSNLSFNNLNKGMYLLRVNVLQTGETLIEKIMVH